MTFERNGETGAITVSQSNYINELLKQHGMINCRPAATQLEAKFQVKCNKENCKKVDQTKYQSLIGSLMYLAISTRPDILHAVSKLSQRNKDPHIEHETGAKHILRYLNKTSNYKLHYFKTGNPIECYADADWGGDTTDRKSYTGYAFILAGSVFSWQSKKQTTVALSSTEAEYMAISAAAKEATYLRKLMQEIGIDTNNAPIKINGDNLSAQQLVRNPVYHARSKHIDIKYHHIREVLNSKQITIHYVPTNDMIADILTKNLEKCKHQKFVKLLGLE